MDLINGTPIVEDVSFAVDSGEILGLVGESGSGKTTAALALLGYARPGVRIRAGSIQIHGEELSAKPERQRRRARGRLVSYVAQDPASALNPSIRVGDQVAEMLRFHGARRVNGAEINEIFARVQLPGDRRFRRRFVHQLSGGQQQRLAIAIALACSPPVLVMDEPTTGLDVVTQARILDEIERLTHELGLSIVYISHNLAVVSTIADRIAVMYAGRIVEHGRADFLLAHPRHPYTLGLLASVPDHLAPRSLRGIPGVAAGVGEWPVGCAFAPRCTQRTPACELSVPSLEETAPDHRVRCFEWRRTPRRSLEPPRDHGELRPVKTPLLSVESLRAEYRGQHGTVVAANSVSFAVATGESVALVGESGSGKTTISRCIAGLHAPSGGDILLDGVPLAAGAKQRPRAARRRIQIVFQNPYDSLNPRKRIGDQVARPARVLRGLSQREARAEAGALLEHVRLSPSLASRFPRELSGGERQRVAIARALAARPDLLICDEITSALDVSVQAAVIDLLATLRDELSLALLFVSHDLGVVAGIADRVIVLETGVIREMGSADDVLARPSDVYTQALIAAVPRLSVDASPEGILESDRSQADGVAS